MCVSARVVEHMQTKCWPPSNFTPRRRSSLNCCHRQHRRTAGPPNWVCCHWDCASNCAASGRSCVGTPCRMRCSCTAWCRCASEGGFSNWSAGWSFDCRRDTCAATPPCAESCGRPACVIGRNPCRIPGTWTASLSSECICEENVRQYTGILGWWNADGILSDWHARPLIVLPLYRISS